MTSSTSEDSRSAAVSAPSRVSPSIALTEPLQCCDRSRVDGHDDVRGGDQFDLAADESIVGVVGLQRLEGDVDPIGRPCQPSAPVLIAEAFQVDLAQVQHADDTGDLVVVASVDVDPEQPLRTERPDDVVGQLDGLVLSVGVEQPGREHRLTTSSIGGSLRRAWCTLRDASGSPAPSERIASTSQMTAHRLRAACNVCAGTVRTTVAFALVGSEGPRSPGVACPMTPPPQEVTRMLKRIVLAACPRSSTRRLRVRYVVARHVGRARGLGPGARERDAERVGIAVLIRRHSHIERRRAPRPGVFVCADSCRCYARGHRP